MARQRTNIEIDEQPLRIVMERYGLRTKTEAVDFALRQVAGRVLSREEMLAMEGAFAIGEIPSRADSHHAPEPGSGEAVAG